MKRELTPEEIAQVDGGLIVAGNDNRFYVVHDRSGDVLFQPFSTLENAEIMARKFRMWPTVISEAEYKSKFGKEFKYQWYNDISE